MASRVVPAVGDTMATSRPASALSRLLFPALGGRNLSEFAHHICARVSDPGREAFYSHRELVEEAIALRARLDMNSRPNEQRAGRQEATVLKALFLPLR